MYSERLPARDPAIAVDHLHVPCDGSNAGFGKMPDEARNRVGIHDGIGVNRDDNFADGLAERMIQRRRFAAIALQEQADPPIASKVRANKLGGAIRRTVVHHENFQLGIIGSKRRANRIHDHRFFVVSGDQNADLRLIFGMVERSGAQLFDQGEQADDQRAPADQQNAREKNERDPVTQPAEHIEGESIGAHHQPFAVGQRRHHVGAALAEQVGNLNEFVALRAQPIDDQRQRRNGVAAVAAAVVHQDDVAAVVFGLLDHTLDDRLHRSRRLAVGLAPIVRIDPRADDHVTHGLRDGKHLNLARRFGLVVDPVRRAEKRGLDAEGCSPEAAPSDSIRAEAAFS